MTQQQVLNIATEIGCGMLRNGAEIYRAETCACMIAAAYGFPQVDCFAILTSIVVTITDGENIQTESKRIIARATNLNKVAELNDLSRHLCSHPEDYETAKRMIQEILQKPSYGVGTKTLGCILTSFFFTLLFGGSPLSAVLAGVIGSIVYPLLHLSGKFENNAFFGNLVISAMVTGVLGLLQRMGYQRDLSTILIGILMNLVPGVAITHCMRDLISNELVSGVARLAETFICAAGIAAGVVFSMAVFGIRL